MFCVRHEGTSQVYDSIVFESEFLFQTHKVGTSARPRLTDVGFPEHQ